MRVGVTGASGFIGHWLVDELNTYGHHVVGCDRLPGRNAHDVFDILEPGALLAWMDRNDLDVIVHLAARVGRVFGEDDLVRTVRDNVEATTLVAQAAETYGTRVVYASTSEIYGDHDDDPVDEDAEWHLPYNLYGLTKRQGEEILRLYVPHNLVVCRLSMPYGPGAPPGRGRRAMDTMLWQAHHGMALTVHRHATRSWCWVGDTVCAIRLAMEHDDPGVYNVGRDDDPRTMLEIARRACDLADAPYELIHEVDPPADQVVVKNLVTDRIRALGWSPTIELDEGMKRVYEYVRRFGPDGTPGDAP